ncbi:hypothetical protein [Corynebacterium sp.]|uniref:hypothetical protein n=1 Tax=Corynebacterium sp. TaxID=1720 RepID=UPI0028A80C20|nr:hypothetical protein [Corynebacterium sp.]
MSLSSLRFSRLSRAGIAAVALAPALVLASPAAVADEAEAPATESSTSSEETTDDGAEGSGSGATDGSLPEGIGSEDAASSLGDADWSKVAGVISDIVGGGVSLDTILDIISLVNGEDATVGDVIGSVSGSLGGGEDEDASGGDAVETDNAGESADVAE